eukprot:gene18538-25045_t
MGAVLGPRSAGLDANNVVYRTNFSDGCADSRLSQSTTGHVRQKQASYNSGSANGVAAHYVKGQKEMGCRALWKEVTRVSKGQKLGDKGGIASSEVTVENLLKSLAKLEPHEPSIEAIETSLSYQDSSATAAFLKELCKQGGIKRAVEIFDWLRALPPNHELARLCDLYTYTTMISQCGTRQQLRRALELVAEMRSRGIQANVRTFSALMNVCMKANELDLVQDVYQQMLDEGCTPNLVTHNILIGVCVKKGDWEESLEILAQLEKQVCLHCHTHLMSFTLRSIWFGFILIGFDMKKGERKKSIAILAQLEKQVHLHCHTHLMSFTLVSMWFGFILIGVYMKKDERKKFIAILAQFKRQ